jgi:hypothetical protein
MSLEPKVRKALEGAMRDVLNNRLGKELCTDAEYEGWQADMLEQSSKLTSSVLQELGNFRDHAGLNSITAKVPEGSLITIRRNEWTSEIEFSLLSRLRPPELVLLASGTQQCKTSLLEGITLQCTRPVGLEALSVPETLVSESQQNHEEVRGSPDATLSELSTGSMGQGLSGSQALTQGSYTSLAEATTAPSQFHAATGQGNSGAGEARG